MNLFSMHSETSSIPPAAFFFLGRSLSRTFLLLLLPQGAHSAALVHKTLRAPQVTGHCEHSFTSLLLPGPPVFLFLDLFPHFAGAYSLVASWERVSAEQVPQELTGLKCHFSILLLTACPSGSRVSAGHHFPAISGRHSFTACEPPPYCWAWVPFLPLTVRC